MTREAHSGCEYLTVSMYFFQLTVIVLHLSAASVLHSDIENRLMMMEGHMAQRKVPSCIPHDIGDPGDPLFL